MEQTHFQTGTLERVRTAWENPIFLLISWIVSMTAAMADDLHDRCIELSPGLYGQVLVSESNQAIRAGIVIVHGSGGLRPVYFEEAEALVDEGFITLVLNLYREEPYWSMSGKKRAEKWVAWQELIKRAVDYLRKDDANLPVGLLRFSQGAALSMSVAGEVPRVQAVASFFGPSPDSWYVENFFGFSETYEEFISRINQFPPTLLVHGGRDPIVSSKDSRQWEAKLRKADVRLNSLSMQNPCTP